MDDNRRTYQMTQMELNLGSKGIHKIIHELHVKKVVCRWVHHNLIEHQKEERVIESAKKPLN
ncbi:UNVERIFIED_CONTAM: hypothetical protein NCL1_30830 [Trichonephila clavipes]